jgi:SPP1 family predicted phage head-tail adaptor
MMPLQVGECRNQVTFQEFVSTSQDSQGQNVGTWTNRFTLWCKVEEGGGRELNSARQTFAEAKYVIRTFRPPVTIERAWRAIKDGGFLNILDAGDPFGTRREVLIIAREFVE